MSAGPSISSCPPCRLPRHPVISWGEAARRLGVSKSHLWRVANGKRQGAQLAARYTTLLREHSATP
jgi:uncharacterized C2H2 Zn-finger protein